MPKPNSDLRTRASSGDSLFTKKASFIQHALPGLDSGRYQITVKQSLTQNGNDITLGGLPSITRAFGVTGPRYSLPANAVHSAFPPPNSSGEYSNSIAHVVLETETLPWQHSPYLQPPVVNTYSYTTTVEGKTVTIDYDEDVASWLVVVLVSPSDFGGQDPSRLIVQGTVLDLIPQALQGFNGKNPPVQGTLPANGYSLFSYLLGEQSNDAVDPGVGQNIQDAIQYIDLPCTLFDALAPSLEDLTMMAHVRAVEMDAKPLVPGTQTDPVQQYALALGNRLPESLPPNTNVTTAPPPGTNVGLLVSLEMMEPALRGHAANTYYATNIDTLGNGFVRLPVLYSWRFASQQDTSAAFETTLESLNGRDPSNPTNLVPNPQFRFPNPPTFETPTTAQAVTEDMLASGYLPFNHLTRLAASGEPSNAPAGQVQTVSWLRGPLMPMAAFSPASLPNPATTYSSDTLLRFDPNVGLYDVSYAAAWQLGRMLALQHPDFSQTQYRWKQRHAVSHRVTVERDALTTRYPRLAGGGQTAGRDLKEHILRGLVGSAAIQAVPSPEATPTDFPPLIPGWLAQLQTLQGVPFPYLVADEVLLPAETVRFFQIDPAWFDSLMDGALSIGRHYTATGPSPFAADQTYQADLKAAVVAAVPNIRRSLLKKPPLTADPTAAGTMVTGFILRSQAVATWKSMDVNGYLKGSSPYDYETGKIPAEQVQSSAWLRLERLSADVLIGLFPGALYELVLHQPPEAIHFGFSTIDFNQNSVAKQLRTPTLGWDDPNTKYQMTPGEQTLDGAFVNSANRVLGLYSLSQEVGTTLNGLSAAPGYYQNPPSTPDFQDHLVSSDFALEMVEGVGLVSFINDVEPSRQ